MQIKDYVRVTTPEGEHTIDLSPVRDFEIRLTQEIDAKHFFDSSDVDIDAIKGMSKDQLEYLAVMLAGEVRRYAWLYSQSFRPAHQKLVTELRELALIAKKQGQTLWPELLEK